MPNRELYCLFTSQESNLRRLAARTEPYRLQSYRRFNLHVGAQWRAKWMEAAADVTKCDVMHWKELLIHAPTRLDGMFPFLSVSDASSSTTKELASPGQL